MVQSAIASTPGSVAGGYLVGGVVWFVIAMSIMCSLGLAALAASLPISAEEAANGEALRIRYLLCKDVEDVE